MTATPAPEPAPCPACHARRAMFRQQDGTAACRFCGATFQTRQSEHRKAVRIARYLRTKDLTGNPAPIAPGSRAGRRSGLRRRGKRW